MNLQEYVTHRGLTSLGTVALDQNLCIVAVSEGVVVETGLERTALLGRSAMDLVHPDDLHRALNVLEEVKAIPGDRPDGMYRLVTGDGSYRYFAVRATNLGPDHDGTMIFDFDDATDEVRARSLADDVVDIMRMLSEEVSLDESLDWVARIAERHVEGLQIVITMFGEDGAPNRVFSRQAVPEEILFVNENARADALPIHVEVAFAEIAARRWLSSRKIASLDYIVPGRLTSVLVDRTGAIVGYVEALRGTVDAPDDTEWLVQGMISRMMNAALHRFEFDRQLRRAADLDPLTGLLNRRKLFELLEANDQRAGSQLYLIDLDRFSWVNNNLGHQAGDDTLQGVARALTLVCPPDALIARLGGDEFVVWTPPDQSSLGLGERISEAMVVSAGADDQRVWVRASIGMVRIADGEAVAAALNRADVAMYASKRGGGDTVTAG